MQIRHAGNGGLAEVDDEFGKQLIASGQWVSAKKRRQSPAKQETESEPEPVAETEPESEEEQSDPEE